MSSIARLSNSFGLFHVSHCQLCVCSASRSEDHIAFPMSWLASSSPQKEMRSLLTTPCSTSCSTFVLTAPIRCDEDDAETFGNAFALISMMR